MERLEKIKNRWMPDDGFGIGHPIHTDELEEDVRCLVALIEKQQREIEELKAEKQILSSYKYMYEQARYSK